MALTDIANRLTPSNPIEITFGELTLALGARTATIFGHRAASGGTASDYDVHNVINVGDAVAALAEVDALAGTGSELGKMAAKFIQANQQASTATGRNYAPFRIVIIPNAVTDFGPADEATQAVKLLRSDILVSPYAAEDTANLTKMENFADLISGVDRDLNGQFGSHAVVATMATSATALAIAADNQYIVIPYLQDTAVSPANLDGEVAAAFAGLLMNLQFPFFGISGEEIGGLLRPVADSDIIIVDPSGLSESALVAGLSPLTVDAAGRVRGIRSRISAVTTDGVTPLTAYFDWQDRAVLYSFREVCFLLEQQPQFKNKKASKQQAALLKDEVLRAAFQFEAQSAFQAVQQLAPLFQVATSTSSRGRFDFKIPVNVLPINYVIAGNIQATVLFDQFTV